MSKIANLYHKLPRPMRQKIRGTVQRIRIATGAERHFVRVEDYISAHPDMAEYIYREDSQLQYATPRYAVSEESSVHDTLLLHGGVIRFSRASCFAKSDIIQMPSGELWYELRDLYQTIHKGCSCSDSKVLIADNRNWYETKTYKQVEHIEKGFFLSGIFSGNYYHFMLAILPRLRWMASVPKYVPLLVDRSVEKYASYQQLLSYCNTEKRPIVFLEEGARYEVEELYVATTQMMAQPNYSPGQKLTCDDDQYNMAAMNYVREQVLQHVQLMDNLPKRFFISRKNASGLRKFNEQECIDALRPLGFEVVYPETYSLEQQVALFHQAECIVGGSGAAFTNLLFATKKAKVVVLEGYQSHICIFSTIASFVKADLMYIYDKSLGEIPNGDYIHADFNIDTKALVNSINL